MKQFLLQPKTAVYLSGFLFAAHLALTAYVNSSFLSSFIPQASVGFIYSLAAIVSITGILCMPRVLRSVGLYRFLVLFLATSALCTLGLAYASTPLAAAAYFIIWLGSNSLIALSLDELLENYSADASTGTTRGTYLTTLNVAWLLSPMLSGLLSSRLGYSGLYTVASCFVVGACIIALVRFRKFIDPPYQQISIRDALRTITSIAGLRRIFVANLILQGFYVIMVVYTPIYLHQHIGLDWKTLGVIFTIMLLPFVLFEYPLGRLADRIGEKKILVAGFLVAAAATFAVGSVGGTSAALWAAVLFMTRTGASAIEIMTESYFWKTVSGRDASVISTFRTLSPIAYIIVPAIAAGILHFVPITSLFFFAAAALIAGAFIARKLASSPR